MIALQTRLPAITIAGGVTWLAVDREAATALQERHDRGSRLLQLLLRHQHAERGIAGDEVREAMSIVRVRGSIDTGLSSDDILEMLGHV